MGNRGFPANFTSHKYPKERETLPIEYYPQDSATFDNEKE